VDLLTGEPAKVQAPQKPAKPAFEMKNLKAKMPKVGAGILAGAGKIPGKITGLIQKKLIKKPLAATQQQQAAEMTYCMQCGGVMKPAIQPYYPSQFIYPFLGLAVILFVLSFHWRLLAITGVMSVAGFFVFRSLRVDLWRCQDCRHEHAREKPKKAAKAK
jgi:hypothetical protein